MNYLTILLRVNCGILFFVFSQQLSAQENTITISQDSKFNSFLIEKIKNNSNITTDDRYKIQIFSGTNENSRIALNEFKSNFVELDATIVFNTPNYKVWVGDYKTRLDAERNLALIKSKYSNALLIKP